MNTTTEPNPEMPDAKGKRWLHEEDEQLLLYFKNATNITEIAHHHKRTEGGIRSRLRTIAYDMYCKEIPMEEITQKTGVSHTDILDMVERKKTNVEKKKVMSYGHLTTKDEVRSCLVNKSQPLSSGGDSESSTVNEPTLQQIHVEVQTMKTEMRELKNNIKELVELLQAVYEFGEE